MCSESRIETLLRAKQSVFKSFSIRAPTKKRINTEQILQNCTAVRDTKMFVVTSPSELHVAFERKKNREKWIARIDATRGAKCNIGSSEAE